MIRVDLPKISKACDLAKNSKKPLKTAEIGGVFLVNNLININHQA